MLAVFGVGTVVMRSAGCTVNDLWDRDFDKKVERTRNRPITSGEITVPQGEFVVIGFENHHCCSGYRSSCAAQSSTIFL